MKSNQQKLNDLKRLQAILEHNYDRALETVEDGSTVLFLPEAVDAEHQLNLMDEALSDNKDQQRALAIEIALEQQQAELKAGIQIEHAIDQLSAAQQPAMAKLLDQLMAIGRAHV